MIDLTQYMGLGVFGRAFQKMFENDSHVTGSVDRVLMERMILLCAETTSYLYGEYTPTQVLYQGGSRPELERRVEEATADCVSDEDKIVGIAKFCSELGKAASDDLETMLVGGTEEEVISRRSDWCPEVARVGCVLCQVAGFPARIVYLVDTQKAYSGHAIIETYRAKVWGALDPLTDVVYRHSRCKPASTLDLMNDPTLVERHWRDESTPYTKVGKFRGAAISNYFVWRWKEYDYTISRINDYYRSILEMANRGWPGGQRWLHGEDNV